MPLVKSVEEVVECIKSDDYVFLHTAAATPHKSWRKSGKGGIYLL